MKDHINELLLEVYRQCHEHTRDTDKKRDQIIGSYLVIVGLLYGVIDKLEKYGQLKDIIALVVGCVGIVALLTIINYRKWHVIHTNAAIVIHFLIKEKIEFSEDNINKAWNKLVDKRGIKVLNPIGSVDASLFFAFVIISFLPWCLLIVDGYVYIKIDSFALAIIFDFIILWLIPSYLIAYWIINKADKSVDKNFWAFRPYRAG